MNCLVCGFELTPKDLKKSEEVCRDCARNGRHRYPQACDRCGIIVLSGTRCDQCQQLYGEPRDAAPQ